MFYLPYLFYISYHIKLHFTIRKIEQNKFKIISANLFCNFSLYTALTRFDTKSLYISYSFCFPMCSATFSSIKTAYRQNATAFFYKQAKLHTITETSDFCVIVSEFCSNRPSISGIKNAKKRGSPTTPMNPSTPNNSNRKRSFLFILSHSSILLPVSTKNPMASIGNSRLCRC